MARLPECSLPADTTRFGYYGTSHDSNGRRRPCERHIINRRDRYFGLVESYLGLRVQQEECGTMFTRPRLEFLLRLGRGHLPRKDSSETRTRLVPHRRVHLNWLHRRCPNEDCDERTPVRRRLSLRLSVSNTVPLPKGHDRTFGIQRSGWVFRQGWLLSD